MNLDEETLPLLTTWTEALASGKFTQTAGTLCDAGGSMCCLGVKAAIEGRNFFSEYDNYTSRYFHEEDHKPFSGFFESTDPGENYNAGLEEQDMLLLAALNDEHSYVMPDCTEYNKPPKAFSFPEIAALLQRAMRHHNGDLFAAFAALYPSLVKSPVSAP